MTIPNQEWHIYRPGDVKPQIEQVSKKEADTAWRLRELVQGTPTQITLMYHGQLQTSYVNEGTHSNTGAELRFNAFATNLRRATPGGKKLVRGTLVVLVRPDSDSSSP